MVPTRMARHIRMLKQDHRFHPPHAPRFGTERANDQRKQYSAFQASLCGTDDLISRPGKKFNIPWMGDHILQWPPMPEVEPLSSLCWNGSIQEKERIAAGPHGCRPSMFMLRRLLPESWEDDRIGIVWKPISPFRREIVKEDMPGDALSVTMEVISIVGVLQMYRERESRCLTGVRPASVNQAAMMHAEFAATKGHRNLGDRGPVGEPSF